LRLIERDTITVRDANGAPIAKVVVDSIDRKGRNVKLSVHFPVRREENLAQRVGWA
jgi:hypothetical protein